MRKWTGESSPISWAHYRNYGMDQWDCNIVNYYNAHTWLTSCDVQSLPVNATLWRQLLKQLLVLGSASYEAFSKAGNTVVTVTGTRSEDRCHLQSVGIVLQLFSRFPKHGLRAYTLPPPLSSHRLPKNGKQTLWTVKEASQAFYGYPQTEVSGKMVHSTSSLPKW